MDVERYAESSWARCRQTSRDVSTHPATATIKEQIVAQIEDEKQELIQRLRVDRATSIKQTTANRREFHQLLKLDTSRSRTPLSHPDR